MSILGVDERTDRGSRSRAWANRVRPGPPPLLVEVPGESAGLSLIEHLWRFYAELTPLDSTRCAVGVDVGADGGRVDDAIDVVRRWLPCAGVPLTCARLGDRTYTIDAT